MTIAPKLVLDFRGLCCPMPIVKLAQIVRQLQIGEEVEAVATDPGVMSDVPAWARSTGNEVVCIEQRDKDFRFVVRRWK
jgi:tRNA 2-thiouridine synthesizing protein A